MSEELLSIPEASFCTAHDTLLNFLCAWAHSLWHWFLNSRHASLQIGWARGLDDVMSHFGKKNLQYMCTISCQQNLVSSRLGDSGMRGTCPTRERIVYVTKRFSRHSCSAGVANNRSSPTIDLQTSVLITFLSTFLAIGRYGWQITFARRWSADGFASTQLFKRDIPLEWLAEFCTHQSPHGITIKN